MSTTINSLALLGACCSVAFAGPLSMSDIVARAKTPKPIWNVEFWEGEQCTSSSTKLFDGPTKARASNDCQPIPDIGVTQSVTYHGELDYEFRLHTKADCSDNTEYYIGT